MKKITKNLAYGIFSLLLVGGIFTACHKSSGVTPPTPIGGFNSSNDVGAATLKAHWTFDGTANETISSTAPTTNTGTSFGPGIKGQALVLTNGYMLFPTIANLNVANIGSVTVSCWIKVDNNGSTFSNVFSLTQSTTVQTDWNTGAVNMGIETGHGKAT